MMNWAKAVIAGFLATLIFHQGLFTLFHLAGMVPMPAYNLHPVPPLGVPAVISLAFFGGLWGLPIWALVKSRSGAAYWGGAALLGAVGPTAVAMLLVFPLKGLEVTGKTWAGGLMLNAAWGLGFALIMQLWQARQQNPQGTAKKGSTHAG